MINKGYLEILLGTIKHAFSITYPSFISKIETGSNHRRIPRGRNANHLLLALPATIHNKELSGSRAKNKSKLSGSLERASAQNQRSLYFSSPSLALFPSPLCLPFSHALSSSAASRAHWHKAATAQRFRRTRRRFSLFFLSLSLPLLRARLYTRTSATRGRRRRKKNEERRRARGRKAIEKLTTSRRLLPRGPRRCFFASLSLALLRSVPFF